MGCSQSQHRSLNEIPKVLKVVADIKNTEAPRLQRRDPTLWSMTLTQWNQVVSECRSHPLFAELIRKKERDKYVNLYDINDCFVKPWTRGSGCGIALHMNPSGLKAEVMMSHCWAEDVEECQDALRFRFAEFDHAPAVWFCLFAQYQPSDEAGPSIQEQLSGSTDDARPKDSAGKTWTAFKCVIHSVRIMVAIHTTKAELYERLWCVHELDEAMELCRKGDMTVIPALSKQYMDNVDDRFMMAKRAGATDKEAQAFAGFKVVTSRAVCGKADLEMLMAEIFSRPGGFERLDKNINEFRRVVYEQLKARRLQGLPRGNSNVSNASIEFEYGGVTPSSKASKESIDFELKGVTKSNVSEYEDAEQRTESGSDGGECTGTQSGKAKILSL